MEPTQESPARLLYRSPEAVAGVALVVAQELGQHVALDLPTGRRPTAVDEAHHVRIAVQLDEVVDIVRGEPPQQQVLGLQKDLHRPIVPYLGAIDFFRSSLKRYE